MKKIQELWNNFLIEEDAAIDQWISVLVLAILAIIIFIALRPRIINMLNGVTDRTGTQVNALF